MGRSAARKKLTRSRRRSARRLMGRSLSHRRAIGHPTDGRMTPGRPSDLHHFLFLAGDDLVDLGDTGVGLLLHLVEQTLLLVVGDLAFLGHPLDLLVGVAARIAN